MGAVAEPGAEAGSVAVMEWWQGMFYGAVGAGSYALADWLWNRLSGRRGCGCVRLLPPTGQLGEGVVVADSHPQISEQEDRLRAGWKEGKDEG